MPLLAAVAVLLCTAMVLVVWSVMNGFLGMLIGSGRTMTGDVVVRWPNAGFAYYDELISDLVKLPEVEAASPMIESFGLVAFPDGRKVTVTARGIVPESFSAVTSYYDILHWRPIDKPMPKDKDKEDPRLHGIGGTTWAQILDNGKKLQRPDAQGQMKPAVVMGIEMSRWNWRSPNGFYEPGTSGLKMPDGSTKMVDNFMPRDSSVLLNLVPLDSSGKAVEMVTRSMPVANEFQSGLFEVDERVLLMPLSVAQDMLKMNAAKRVVKKAGAKAAQDGKAVESFDDGSEELVDDPARVTDVLVRAKGDVSTTASSLALLAKVEGVYEAFALRHKGKVPGSGSISIMTWEQQNATMISAVKKETVLLLVLFMIISLVAVFLILAIFWSMVAEKTKDIGVLRAVGAGSTGVAALWVSYGLAIGLVGSSLGLGLAYVVVTNINPIHDWLGRALGIVIWDPRIYYFINIPNKVEPDKALMVFVAGVMSSALGALVPAARAAWMRPVRALRFE